MTPEEAVAIFDKMLKRYVWAEDNKSVQAIKIAKECIEKQIPKKPLYIDGDCDLPLCPHCRMAIDETEDTTVCKLCKQSLDWSDT